MRARVDPGTPDDTNWSFQFRNEEFYARSRKSRDCAEACCSTSHKKSRRLTQRLRKKTIYGWKLVRLLSVGLVFLLSLMSAPAVGTDGQSAANTHQSKDNSQDASFGELLEFLGQWETDDGNWVDPTDLDWLMMPEQESKDDEKKKP